MAQLSITFNGRSYVYNGHRYDHLVDAVNYAELMQTHPERNTPGPFVIDRRAPSPSAADIALMDTLAIVFDAGTYRFDTFRYDHLADAVNYARAHRA